MDFSLSCLTAILEELFYQIMWHMSYFFRISILKVKGEVREHIFSLLGSQQRTYIHQRRTAIHAI
jgi:hypothetical protein